MSGLNINSHSLTVIGIHPISKEFLICLLCFSHMLLVFKVTLRYFISKVQYLSLIKPGSVFSVGQRNHSTL